MKKNIAILSLAVWVIGGACSDWLTIQPETTVSAETLFKTDVGVKQGLNGAYYKATSLYSPAGDFGGGGFMEDMANTYYYSNLLGGYGWYWANHVYDYNKTGQDYITGLTFMGMYNIIANLNSLLGNMEKEQGQISDDVYQIVRGEAYAFRACCHLDLMRLWGPVPSAAEDGKNYLPYVRVNDSKDYEYHTFVRFMDYVQEDLDSAEFLLQKAEPVLTTTFEATEMTTAEWPYRKSRFNYYGVLALQARAALWRGDKEKALRYAKMVKDAANEDGSLRFRLTTPEDDVTNYTLTDKTHYSEHICGIKCEEFDVSSMNSPWAYRYLSAYNNQEYITELYGVDYKTDLRYVHFWAAGSGSWQLDPVTGEYVYVVSSYTINKYGDFLPSLSSQHNFPIVRLPEMYFIIMECGTLSEANILYQEYCKARNIAYVPLTETDRQERIMLEGIREYVAEGQNFFIYKRNNAKQMVGGESDWEEADYILPIPEDEFVDEK